MSGASQPPLYIMATIKPWNLAAFEQARPSLPGRWLLVTRPEDLSPDLVSAHQPRYIFFPHWSWIVPDPVLAAAECVCFHMADVPYGRGGSPLQNLIVRGHRETKLTALRMVDELDAGPVYMKRPMTLDGSARAILTRASALVMEMIAEIVAGNPAPVPQSGEPTVFRRRKPADSILPADGEIPQIYDHIRMLDADGYPPAFIDHGPFRLEFAEAELSDGRVSARATIYRRAPHG